MNPKNEHTANINTDDSVAENQNSDRLHTRLGWFGKMGLVLAISVGLSAFFAWRSTQSVPEFYQSAIDREPESWKQAGEELESQLLQLNSDVLNQEYWLAEFTAEQINAWLVMELPAQFPNTLPKEVSDPRIAFAEEEVKLAFRCTSKKFSGIVSGSVNVFCTGKPNQLAVQIKNLKSGVVPLPISPWAEKISRGFAKHDITVTWSQKDGDTLALVDLPDKFLNIQGRRVSIDAVVIQDDLLKMSGQSAPVDRITNQTNEAYGTIRFSKLRSPFQFE